MKRTFIAPFVFTVMSVFLVSQVVYGQSSTSNTLELRKAQLNAELQLLEFEIERERGVLQEKQKESVSLERDISILNSKINKAQLGIKARTISISNLLNEIDAKTLTISKLDEKTGRAKASLSQLLRRTNEIDEYSLIEVMFGQEKLSNFFLDVDSFNAIELALNQSFEDIRSVKREVESEKRQLEEKRLEEVDLRQLQELESQSLEGDEREKERILTVTKGEERVYQEIIQEKEESAADIRSALFALRGSGAISFERALELAYQANAKTGVRPAFLLGIIAEESNLGQNLGSGTWSVDMHPDRDRPVFLEICERLGFDPDAMPVSKKPWYGWGGAMGPAQFIPSTWVLYEDRIGQMTGHIPPNPWEPEDAFMASSVLLMDNGADAGTYAAERLAALRYLAGWKNATNPDYAFYGDEVMALAAKYQRQIDIVMGN